jgi:uncharacterized protein (DUF1810 family)
MSDPFELERFVKAQDPVIEEVSAELKRGAKEGHWMWFVFPQLKGLGSSWMAEKYGISSLDEAKAYLAHPVLGPRLIECTGLLNRVKGRSAEQILGSIDALKFRSSMTLFSAAAPGDETFRTALDKYFGGKPDQLTLDRLVKRT